MQCPRCGLVNSNQSICQCGYLLTGSAYTARVSASSSNSGVSEDERNWAIAVHCCELAGLIFPFASLIGPVVIFILKRKESAFVGGHARTAINMQITGWLLAVVAVLSFIVALQGVKQQMFLWTIPGIIFGSAIVIFGVAAIVFTIVGLIRAREGRVYRYPLAIPFLGR